MILFIFRHIFQTTKQKHEFALIGSPNWEPKVGQIEFNLKLAAFI